MTRGFGTTNSTVDHADTSRYGGGAPVSWSSSESGPYAQAFAPLLIHPVPHFYVGFGPAIHRDLGRRRGKDSTFVNNRTTVAAYLTTGIWF